MKFQQDAVSCQSAHRAKLHNPTEVYVPLSSLPNICRHDSKSSQSRRVYAFPSIGLDIIQELCPDSIAVLILVKLNIHKCSILKTCNTIFTV